MREAVNRAHRWWSKLRHRGPVWIGRSLAARIIPARLEGLHELRRGIAGAQAVEIGGPSFAFSRRGLIPLYDTLGSLDLVDSRDETVWTRSGETNRSRMLPPGRLVVAEATRLPIDAGSYDVLVNAGVLEHVADPLTAIVEWKRVLRRGGLMLVLVPRREETFDRLRPITTADHLENDRGRSEDDLTHLDEVLRLYDHTRAEEMLSPEAFRARCERNTDHRWMHHHVFDDALVRWAMEAAGLQVEDIKHGWPFWICISARVPLSEDRGNRDL